MECNRNGYESKKSRANQNVSQDSGLTQTFVKTIKGKGYGVYRLGEYHQEEHLLK